MKKGAKKPETAKMVSKEKKAAVLVAKAPKARPVRSSSVSVTQPDPLLQAYLREVHKYPLLTREQEHELAVKYHKTQDREALQALVTGNLRFVVKIAYEYVHYRMKLLDLIQEGNMGLVKAVKEFDPYKDVRLTTYAVWWIRSYIQEAILKNYSLVKMGTTQAQKKLFYRLRKEQKKIDDMQLSNSENVKLLASRLDVKEKEVEEMDQRLAHNDLSLNAPITGEDKKQHMDNLTSTTQAADEMLGDMEQKDLFKKILGKFAETLEGREKVIFNSRLVSENPMTLQEIGDKYKVTKERARQIEESIKDKLKLYMKEHYPDFAILTNE